MKSTRTFLAVLAIAVVSIPASLEAQIRTWEGSIGAGPSLPVGKLADETTSVGLHVMGSVTYSPRALPFGVRAELFFQNFWAAEREPSIDAVLGGEWYRQLGGGVSAKYGMDMGTWAPYLLVGAGWHRNWHFDRRYWPEEQRTLSLAGGVGVDFSAFGANGFLELRHLNLVGGEALETRPPTIHREVPFKSLPVTLGIRF